MDVKHLPLEAPHAYRDVQHHLVQVLLPGLRAVVEPALPQLPPRQTAGDELAKKQADQARTVQLTEALLQGKQQLWAQAWQALQAGRRAIESRPLAGNASADDNRWDLLLWLIEGLLDRCDFDSKGDKPERLQHAPHYLYRLGQQLSKSGAWRTTHVVKSVQEVMFELSAEHSRERMQAYYGQTRVAINRITKVLRPVDLHQNAALGLLQNRHGLPQAAAWVVGEPHTRQEFAILSALRRWCINVPWLMNWTTHFGPIQQAMQAQVLVQGEASARKLTPLSSNKDVYPGTPDQAVKVLDEALQQLAELHELGGVAAAPEDLADWHERLDHLAEASGPVDAEPGQAHGAPQAEDDDQAHPLATVFAALDGLQQPFVREAVLLRLLKRVPNKQDRLALGKALVAWWQRPMYDGQSLFERVGVKPGVASLTDAALARACGVLPATFTAWANEALAQFDRRATGQA